jgi:hypothetical protein
MESPLELAIWRTRAAIETLEKIDADLHTLGRREQSVQAKDRIRQMRRLGYEALVILYRDLAIEEATDGEGAR